MNEEPSAKVFDEQNNTQEVDVAHPKKVESFWIFQNFSLFNAGNKIFQYEDIA